MACCAFISQCISRHYPCYRCLPRTLIIIILAWPLPLEFLQSIFGGSSHNRTAGCGQRVARQAGRRRVWETLFSCEAEHMLCSSSPLLFFAGFNGLHRVHYQSPWPKASSIFMHICCASVTCRASNSPVVAVVLVPVPVTITLCGMLQHCK